MKKPFFFLALLQCSLFLPGEEPWGRDQELLSPPSRVVHVDQNPLQSLGYYLIRFHQEVISPADGPRSHFKPSSSQYTLDAIRRYGFFLGVAKGCDRLMRENDEPWVYRTTIADYGLWTKVDPVR